MSIIKGGWNKRNERNRPNEPRPRLHEHINIGRRNVIERDTPLTIKRWVNIPYEMIYYIEVYNCISYIIYKLKITYINIMYILYIM